MTHTCANCGAKDVERVILEVYNYDGLGIPIVIGRSAMRTTCKVCEQHSHTIPDLDGLKAAVAISTVLDPSKLTNRKIKFLRKAMDLKAHQLAEKLGSTAETISRIEREHIELSASLDLRLRLCVIDALQAKAPGIDIDISVFAKMANNVRRPSPNENCPVWFEQVKHKTFDHRLWDRDVRLGVAA